MMPIVTNMNSLGFVDALDGHVDLSILDDYVERKLLRKTKHPTKDLFLYKYTEQCVFDKQWDYITLMCRGIVVNANGKIVSHPFHKFFNYGEQPSGKLPSKEIEYEVYEKMDGSLIVVSIDDAGELLVTSSGSFESDQAKWAKDWLTSNYLDQYITGGRTYVFELIHPENQIVVNYGQEYKLVLLGVRDTETGEDYDYQNAAAATDWKFESVKRYDGKELAEVLKEQKNDKFTNREGYIIKWENGFRLKVKFDEYCRIHRIRTEFTERHIWESMRDGVDLPLDNLPDEMHDWIKETQTKIQDQYNNIETTAQILYMMITSKESSLCENITKKEFAKEVMKSEYDLYRPILFNMFNGKSYSHYIWKELKPC